MGEYARITRHSSLIPTCKAASSESEDVLQGG